MQNNDFRAKQFLPFDSLTGFRDFLKKVEDGSFEDDILFDSIKCGDKVKVKYCYDESIFECRGIVRRVDLNKKKLYLINSIIDLDDILNIDILNKDDFL